MKYDVEFKGLREGLHEFEFEVQDAFFEHFEQGLVNKGDVRVRVQLEKRSSFMKLFFELSGNVELVCDRCLDNYLQELDSSYELFVKYGENEYDDDKVIWILPEEHKINLVQLIYEYIILSLPLRQVHPEDEKGMSGCNREMLRKLEEHKIKEEENKETDPRWSALKNWNNNQN